MLRPRHVRVGQFIYDGNCWMAGDDTVYVHLFQGDAAILYLSHRHALQITYESVCLRAPVSLYDPDHDVYMLTLERVSVFEHLVGLTDAGGRADIDAQVSPLALLQLGEQRFGRRSSVVIAHLGL